MNERIKELAEKAGFPEWTDKTIGFELEKFAQLIIEECVKVADESQFKYLNFPCSIAIEQHFGVE